MRNVPAFLSSFFFYIRKTRGEIHLRGKPRSFILYIKAQEFKSAGRLIRQRLKEFHGREYYVIRGAAEILESSDPLAATLLYRKMMEAILEEAKYKYYNYAATDYVRCGLLSTNIVKWEEFQSHDEFSTNLKEKHKRKSGFWDIYQTELHKQTAKQMKELEKRLKRKD